MNSQNDSGLTGKEQGLVKHLSRRNKQLGWEQDQHKKDKREAMKLLYKFGGEDACWEYMVNIGEWRQAYLPTTIGEYENKKGKVSLAHFNANGKYVGSVRAKGEEPFLTITNTQMTEGKKELWKFNPTHFHYYPIEPTK